MLMNLSPKNNFHTEAEKWTRYMNKHRLNYDDEYVRYKSFKFNDMFESTGYNGIYWASVDSHTINRWCKQTIVYNTKGFRNRLNVIDRYDIDSYMDTDSNAWTYGMADNIEQIIEFYNDNRDKYFKGNHVILLHKVIKHPENPCSGFRPHKHGEYIGNHTLTCEYFNDELDIDELICFSIYQVF